MLLFSWITLSFISSRIFVFPQHINFFEHTRNCIPLPKQFFINGLLNLSFCLTYLTPRTWISSPHSCSCVSYSSRCRVFMLRHQKESFSGTGVVMVAVVRKRVVSWNQTLGGQATPKQARKAALKRARKARRARKAQKAARKIPKKARKVVPKRARKAAPRRARRAKRVVPKSLRRAPKAAPQKARRVINMSWTSGKERMQKWFKER